MIDAAEAQEKRVGVQGHRYEGYMVWINALVSSGGGQIIENAEAGRGRRARRWPRPPATPPPTSSGRLARSSAAPPDLSTATEEEARSLFQGDNGGFMVNWPYVYQAAKPAVAAGALEPGRRRRHRVGPLPRGRRRRGRAPRRSAASTSASATSRSTQAEALDAVKCITSVENNAQYMVESGNPAARAARLRRPGGAGGVPDGRPHPRVDRRRRAPARHPVLRRRVELGAAHLAPRRRRCSAPQTPEETDTYMAEVLSGERLL